MLLGLDAFASGGPVLLLTVVGGALADQRDRRRVIAVCQGLQMLCPVTVVGLLITGALKPWMVVSLSLVIGVTDALSMPSFQTIVSSIVQADELPAGIALNSTQFNLSRILGPTLAGILMTRVGATGAYAISAASYLPFIAVALWILPRTQDRLDGASRRLSLSAELRGVLREGELGFALLTVLLTGMFCAPLITFCPVLVQAVFGANVGQFSLTVAAFGAGGMVGAMGLMAVDPQRDRRTLASTGAVLYGGAVVWAALNHWFYALPALFCVAGAAMTASNASANAHLQKRAPAGIRGEAVGLFMMATRGGVAAGNLAAGFLVSTLGVQHALLIDGVLAVALQLTVAWLWRRRASGGPAAGPAKVL